jgi:magnesium-transporting ATPase (P-type)
MNIFRVSVEEALSSLGSGLNELTPADAARRLREFGPSRIERVRGESVLRRLLKSFTHFFAILLWVAAAIALFAEWSQPGQGMGTLAVAIVGVILINGLFGFWQEYKAERTLAALARLLPVVVKTLRDGTVALLPAEEVVPGDLLVLAHGDNIPADCRLIVGSRPSGTLATMMPMANRNDCHNGRPTLMPRRKKTPPRTSASTAPM